jgi:hypothetical protein
LGAPAFSIAIGFVYRALHNSPQTLIDRRQYSWMWKSKNEIEVQGKSPDSTDFGPCNFRVGS